MLTSIREKIRALVGDSPTKSDFETFEYSTSSVFTLAESNIISITSVEKNGVELGSGDYSFDSSNNRLTISASLSSGDIVTAYYTFYENSNSELNEYVKAALVWISVYTNNCSDYEFENDESDEVPGFIFPTPDNRTLDLIALICAVLIKPDYTSYRLPNLTVNYANRMSKEDKIEKLINKFSSNKVGITTVLEFD